MRYIVTAEQVIEADSFHDAIDRVRNRLVNGRSVEAETQTHARWKDIKIKAKAFPQQDQAA